MAWNICATGSKNYALSLESPTVRFLASCIPILILVVDSYMLAWDYLFMSPTFLFVCRTSVPTTADLARFLTKKKHLPVYPLTIYFKCHVVANKSSSILCPSRWRDGGFGGHRVLQQKDKTLVNAVDPMNRSTILN